MLALGRGLMSNARLLVIDEPSVGLAPGILSELYDKICRLRERGYTLLISEQNVDYISNIAQRLYLMEKGRITLEGGTNDVLNNKYVQESYLGVR